MDGVPEQREPEQREPEHRQLAARLERVEAELAIRRLVAEYAHGGDKRDLRRFLAAFHPDAVWDVGTARFTGHAEMADAIERQWAGQPQMHHWTTNHSLTLTGPDTAAGECDAVVLTRTGDGRWLHAAGTYLDRYTRRAGVWRIAERRALVHAVVRLPDAPVPGAGTG